MVVSNAQSMLDSERADPRYLRVMCSPHLKDELHDLCTRFLSPDELHLALNDLVKQLEIRDDIEVVQETLGTTAGGRALIGWSLRKPDQVKRPIILSASQHHGPENIGASVALYFSHLLLNDPLITPLLDRYQFTFFPQQNPDALEERGNLIWMREPYDLTRLIERYQYDPRCVDVEHGVPHSCLSTDPSKDHKGRPLAHFKRVETAALVRWIDATLADGHSIAAYLSGHAWDVLNKPLFLLSGSSAAHEQRRAWVERILSWVEIAPFELNPAPPLSSDYVLHSPDLDIPLQSTTDLPLREHTSESRSLSGIYKAPHFDDFHSLNEQSAVMYSTLAYVETRAPEAVVVVLEPPIVDSDQFIERPDSLGVSRLREAFLTTCARHDLLVKSITRSTGWSSRPSSQELESQLLAHGGEGIQAFIARIILEILEQSEVYGVWERFFRSIDSGALQLSLSASQLLVATASQQFATANLAAQILRLHDAQPRNTLLSDVDLDVIQELYQATLGDLKRLDLKLFPQREASFVYIAAILAAAELDGLSA